MRVLLAGWFSFDEVIATVGDEVGADVVARWLADLGVDHDVAWAPYTERGMDWRDVDPADYTHLVFRALPWFELDVDLYEKPHARRPAQVEAPVRRADLVVGMRLHALVLGLEHSRPVVACDPVDGGARVTSQAAALDRPLVVPVEELTAEALDAALARCLSGEPAERVHAAGERGRDGNARARAWFEEQLAS